MMPENQRSQDRKPYRKPAMIQVPLRPEEAVLGYCKTAATAAGPGGSNCQTPVQCYSEGS